eukprot:1671051-Prymnesium_polylepis.1
MLKVLVSEVGNCELVTEGRPLTPREQQALASTMLAREGLDGDAPPAALPAAVVAPAAVPTPTAATNESDIEA